MSRACKLCRRPLPPKTGLVFDDESTQVMVAHKAVDLSSAEFLVLRMLVKRPGVTVEREALCDELRLTDPYNLNVHVCRLRKKIGNDRILAVAGVGYRLLGEVSKGRIA